MPVVFVHACIVLRLLYDVALDSFDKPTFCGSLNVKSPSLTRQSSAINEVFIIFVNGITNTILPDFFLVHILAIR